MRFWLSAAIVFQSSAASGRAYSYLKKPKSGKLTVTRGATLPSSLLARQREGEGGAGRECSRCCRAAGRAGGCFGSRGCCLRGRACGGGAAERGGCQQGRSRQEGRHERDQAKLRQADERDQDEKGTPQADALKNQFLFQAKRCQPPLVPGRDQRAQRDERARPQHQVNDDLVFLEKPKQSPPQRSRVRAGGARTPRQHRFRFDLSPARLPALLRARWGCCHPGWLCC